MLSTSQFRKNLFGVFNLLKNTGMTIEIAHKGIVYELSIAKTDKKPKLTRAKRPAKRLIHSLDTSLCKKCGSLMVEGICMNKNC